MACEAGVQLPVTNTFEGLLLGLEADPRTTEHYIMLALSDTCGRETGTRPHPFLAVPIR